METAYAEGIHYRQETVRCGKANCKSCPHGPYWFAYSRRGVMLKKIYVGKDLPAAVSGLVGAKGPRGRRRRR